MNRKGLIATFALTTLLVGSLSHAQAPAGYELALVDVDGTKTVVGQLPPNVYARDISYKSWSARADHASVSPQPTGCPY